MSKCCMLTSLNAIVASVCLGGFVHPFPLHAADSPAFESQESVVLPVPANPARTESPPAIDSWQPTAGQSVTNPLTQPLPTPVADPTQPSGVMEAQPLSTIEVQPLLMGQGQPLTGPPVGNVIDLTEPVDNVWQRIRQGFAIPNLDSPMVSDKQGWYVARPQQLKIMFERASLYLYYITAECERRGLPTELALLPFIESAFNPHALSPARASGLWQFIPSTGKLYGLKQNRLRDERRDIIASTNAALDYLTLLYEMYGDWYLALASYNWGEGSVARAIDKNRSQGLPTDYLSLSMPEETRHYVPKLQAIKNIINTPSAFNIQLPQINNEPYFGAIIKPRGLDVEMAAKMADMSIEEFRALNPGFNKPPSKGADSITFLVPTGKVDLFLSNLDKGSKGGDADTARNADANVSPGQGGIGLKGRMSESSGILSQLSGEGSLQMGDGNTSGLYRDPYQFARHASLLIQANPLAQIKRYTFEEPIKRHGHTLRASSSNKTAAKLHTGHNVGRPYKKHPKTCPPSNAC